jgi:hypothetical protein
MVKNKTDKTAVHRVLKDKRLRFFVASRTKDKKILRGPIEQFSTLKLLGSERGVTGACTVV